MREQELYSLLSSGAAAHYLNVSRQTVHNLVRAGKLPCTRTVLGLLFSLHDLERLREEGERHPSRRGRRRRQEVPMRKQEG